MYFQVLGFVHFFDFLARVIVHVLAQRCLLHTNGKQLQSVVEAENDQQIDCQNEHLFGSLLVHIAVFPVDVRWFDSWFRLGLDAKNWECVVFSHDLLGKFIFESNVGSDGEK